MGASSSKIEYPPLWRAGLWRKSLSEIRAQCAEAFPGSETREPIMCSLEHVVGVLVSAGIKGDLWVDGSFVTLKMNPDDADLLLCVQGHDADNFDSHQQDIADWFVDGDRNLKRWLHLHCFALIRWPFGHCLHYDGEQEYAFYQKAWGRSRANEPKGIAVLELR